MGHLDTAAEPTFHLVPAEIDFCTAKTRWLFGGLGAMATAFVAGLLTFRSGIIGTDGSILYAVAHNAPAGLAGIVNATATPEFSALSYGPVATFSLFVDYAFWHAHTTPYHVTNTILYAICVLLVAAITSHVTKAFGNRFAGAAATWAGLLFALFPGHADALAAISGRVDVLATLFSLTSIFCYLRFRQLRESGYITVALLSFVLALLTDAQALLVPAIVTAAELLLFPADSSKSQRFVFPVFFWMALVFCGTASLVLPFPVPIQHASAVVAAWIATISSPVAWHSLLLSSHEVPDWLRWSATGAYAAAFVLLAARLIVGTASRRTSLWLLLWLVFSLVPQSITPHIDGRMMLLPSAAVSTLIAVACIPAIDIAGKRLEKRFCIAGTAVLVVFCLLFMSAINREQNFWNAQGIRHLQDQPQQPEVLRINQR